MSWVTPPVFVVGQVLTAAQQNIISGDLTYLFNQGPYQQLDRVTGTGATCTATTEGTANTIITGTTLTYPASAVLVEFFAPNVGHSAENNGFIVLLRGATVVVGKWADIRDLDGAGSERKSMKLEFVDPSPPGGSYAYVVQGYTTGGNFNVLGGAGGSGNDAPLFLKTSLTT